MSQESELTLILERAFIGNRELDVQIFALVNWDQTGPKSLTDEEKAFVLEHYAQDSICDQCGHSDLGCPPFTTLLDAKIPGEQIEMVSIQRAKPGDPVKWVALDTNWPKGIKQVAGIGHTEVLARRIAALLAHAARG